jgi:hypothetical protein
MGTALGAHRAVVWSLKRPARGAVAILEKGKEWTGEESKPDFVGCDHLSASINRERSSAHPQQDVGVPPTLTSASSVTGHAWGCSGEDYPFHLRLRRIVVSVALTIGYPTPACAGHPALCCLDFPLPEPYDPESGRASSTVREEYTEAIGHMGPRGPMALVIFVPSVPGVLSPGAIFRSSSCRSE